MATLISHSPEETERFGEELGRRASAGWVIGLSGVLGTGKTHLTRGIARGLGITSRIQSPTFALVIEHHEGRLPLYHLDLFRLENSDQIIRAGLDEYFSPRDGVSVVEWYERWTGPTPAHLCRVQLGHLSEEERRIDYDHPRV